MCVSDGRCVGAGRAIRDDERCAGIERDDNYCGRKGRIDGGGEGEAKVAEGATDEVSGYGRHVQVQELVNLVKCGVRCFPVDWWDVWVLEALYELVDGGGRHGGG